VTHELRSWRRSRIPAHRDGGGLCHARADRRLSSHGQEWKPQTLGMKSLWGFYAQSPSERATQIIERLLDLGERRIRHMDETGIDKAVLALTSPGAQPILDAEEAKRIARHANDYLAEHVAARPDRYVGMTAVAPQDPKWSAAEIRRGAKELGFKGVLINSHTQGEYLDDPKFDPIFRALADTGQLLYIHPSTPPDSMIGPDARGGPGRRDFRFRGRDGHASAAPHHHRPVRSLPRASSRRWATRAKRSRTGRTVSTTCIRPAFAPNATRA
jgi:predicted TIM-barrel fold metal-dependent hydrolase